MPMTAHIWWLCGSWHIRGPQTRLSTVSSSALIEYRYDVPFKFTGTINKVTFSLGPQQLTAQEREQIQETVARARD